MFPFCGMNDASSHLISVRTKAEFDSIVATTATTAPSSVEVGSVGKILQ